MLHGSAWSPFPLRVHQSLAQVTGFGPPQGRRLPMMGGPLMRQPVSRNAVRQCHLPKLAAIKSSPTVLAGTIRIAPVLSHSSAKSPQVWALAAFMCRVSLPYFGARLRHTCHAACWLNRVSSQNMNLMQLEAACIVVSYWTTRDCSSCQHHRSMTTCVGAPCRQPCGTSVYLKAVKPPYVHCEPCYHVSSSGMRNLFQYDHITSPPPMPTRWANANDLQAALGVPYLPPCATRHCSIQLAMACQ